MPAILFGPLEGWLLFYTRVADPGEVDPDPDSDPEKMKKLNPDPTIKENWIWIF